MRAWLHDRNARHLARQWPLLCVMAGLLLAGLWLALPVMAAPLEIYVENASTPWSNPDGTGYANRLVTSAFASVNTQINLVVVPYKRCKLMAMSGQTSACFSMSWEPAMKGLIQFADQPLYEVEAQVFKTDRARFPAVERLEQIPRGRSVGIVNGYEYPEAVTRLAKRGIRFDVSATEAISLRKLKAGRIDFAVIFVDPVKTSQTIVREANAEGVAFAFSAGKQGSYIGFSLAHPEGAKARQLFDEGFAIIKNNGVLKQMMTAWNLHSLSTPD
ncbi:substrate-binding periplasmic protein [Leeia oryzae]|uniref:substrate-binding periplasmic protein n=1 Tax=Leeia oryzae TaxID=356662 RepID=UPI00036E525C|nr:transporter substrate-binding domain-containing protein [Leeia oryzae]